jgi:hypothetical protein
MDRKWRFFARGLEQASMTDDKRADSERASKCSRCGEVVRDIDAGFSPGLQGMGHAGCGGSWKIFTVERPEPAEPAPDVLAARVSASPGVCMVELSWKGGK